MPEAIRILGKPETTLRRLIREGKLEGAQYPRNPDNPQDRRNVWRILLPDAPLADTPSESDDPPPPATEPPAATMWLQELVSERDATIRAKDEQIADQAERMIEMARELGAAQADAAAAIARADDLAEQNAKQAAELAWRRLPWWKRLGGPPT